MSNHVTTVLIGMPWYHGPDVDTHVLYQDFMLYMGALAERTIIRHRLGADAFHKLDLPPLCPSNAPDPRAEPTYEDYERLGRLRIVVMDYSRTSLVGKAREALAESAVNIGADYLMWWDADMKFRYHAFLALHRHQKEIVGALAFTARKPIFPVLFAVNWVPQEDGSGKYEQSFKIFNYPKDTLMGDEHTNGGWLGIGAGFTLIDCGVFKEIPKPWFNSTAAGEDWFFCARAAHAGIPRYCDTSVKVLHKGHEPEWLGEEEYWEERRKNPNAWKIALTDPEDINER